jgi:ABC-2 type transport system permease protein
MWHLTWSLARTEFKLAYFGSVLGYLWQLMRPLMLFGVIYGVISAFDKKLSAGAPLFPVAILLGIVMYNLFSEGTAGAVSCLLNRENLVRKIEFPRLAVPLATGITSLMNYSLNMIPVVVFLLAAGGAIRWTWIEVPALVLLLTAFITGLAAVLSVSYVRYRDVRPIWEVVLQMMFYGSPIFYSISSLKHLTLLGVRVNIAHVMMANPFSAILEQMRHVLISPRYPNAAQAIGGPAMLMIPVGIGLAVIVFGFLLFDREAPRVAEQL